MRIKKETLKTISWISFNFFSAFIEVFLAHSKVFFFHLPPFNFKITFINFVHSFFFALRGIASNAQSPYKFYLNPFFFLIKLSYWKRRRYHWKNAKMNTKNGSETIFVERDKGEREFKLKGCFDEDLSKKSSENLSLFFFYLGFRDFYWFNTSDVRNHSIYWAKEKNY